MDKWGQNRILLRFQESQRDSNHSAQGCEHRATLGEPSAGALNPERGCISRHRVIDRGKWDLGFERRDCEMLNDFDLTSRNPSRRMASSCLGHIFSFCKTNWKMKRCDPRASPKRCDPRASPSAELWRDHPIKTLVVTCRGRIFDSRQCVRGYEVR